MINLANRGSDLAVREVEALRANAGSAAICD
jgi:hypothetical protein